MFNKTNESRPAVFVTQALALLEENDFESFLKQMGHLGKWVQTKLGLSSYKGQEESFETALSETLASSFPPLKPEQKLAFEILQNAWQDRSLAKVKHLYFVEDCDLNTLGEPNSCFFSRLNEKPYWQVVPVDANGEKQKPLDLSDLEDIEELAQKIPIDFINLLPKDYSPQQQALIARLKLALKRAALETLDQSELRAKAKLSKALRHQLKLGMETFKWFCLPTANQVLAEEKIGPALNLEILDQEPAQEELARFGPNTYVVLRPQEGRDGRVFFYASHKKKQKISNKALQQLLSTNNLTFWMMENETFKARARQNFEEKIKKNLLEFHCRQLDAKAQRAIQEYKTFRQKIIRGLEYSLAALTAFVYGTVEMTATMVGFFVTAGIVWTNPWLAIVGALLLAGAVIFPVPSTWANWKIFSTYLPDFFDKIGVEYREINSKRKKGLFWGLALLALATGIASGGLAYTATIALPLMLGLGSLSFIFPPLGVIFAAAIALTQTFSLIRNFTTILRKENSWRSFIKPFQDVKKFLHEDGASRSKRLLTWTLICGLTLLAVLGLAMSCFTSTRSVGKLFIDQFKMAPQKALAFGIAISAVSSFLSRIYMTVSAALSSAIALSRQALVKGPKSIRLSCKKWAAIIIDSLLGAAFYAWSIIHLSQKTPQELEQDVDLHISDLGTASTTALATGAFITTKVRYLTLYLKHAGGPEDVSTAARKKASDQRVGKNVMFFHQDNPQSSFVEMEAKDEKKPCLK